MIEPHPTCRKTIRAIQICSTLIRKNDSAALHLHVIFRPIDPFFFLNCVQWGLFFGFTWFSKFFQVPASVQGISSNPAEKIFLTVFKEVFSPFLLLFLINLALKTVTCLPFVRVLPES